MYDIKKLLSASRISSGLDIQNYTKPNQFKLTKHTKYFSFKFENYYLYVPNAV